MKEGMKLHVSHIDYVKIQSEHEYFIPARNVDVEGVGCGGKPIATVRFWVGT
jgi:hypothetical protein